MVDVDRFKRLNDEYGHTAGDAVLRHVARLLHASVRRTDLIARFGGDEFIVVLPESNAEQASVRMERIRATISETPLPIERGKARASAPSVNVTLSVGISSWPEDGQLSTELIAAADRRMYEEKKRTRGSAQS
jgi:two-component system cell cycle response regulator